MKEEIKKAITEPVEVERVGRGELVKFHTYRIYKSGRIEDCYGNPVDPIIKDGKAYIKLATQQKTSPILIEVARILYCYLVDEIDIMSDNPSIEYLDGDGTNFRLDNIKLVSEIPVIEGKDNKKYFDIEDVLEDEDVISEEGEDNMPNSVEELRDQVKQIETLMENDKQVTGEELIKEVSKKANDLISGNFASEINATIKALKEKVAQLNTLREMDKVAYETRLKEINNEIVNLKNLIVQKENEKEQLLNQNKALLAEKAHIENDMIILTKESFYNMYNTMKKVLAMVDSIEK